MDAASKLGIKRGALRRTIDNRKAAEALEKEFNQISWVGIEVRGTKVMIDVVEKVLPEEDARKSQPGTLLLKRTGLSKKSLYFPGNQRQLPVIL